MGIITVIKYGDTKLDSAEDLFNLPENIIDLYWEAVLGYRPSPVIWLTKMQKCNILSNIRYFLKRQDLAVSEFQDILRRYEE